MASTPLNPVVSGIFLTDSFVNLYTVPSGVDRFGIDAACFNNTSGSNETYTVRLIQAGDSETNDELITEKPVRAQGNDLAPGIIGQSLLTGGIIQAKASNPGVISVSITGTTVS